jgi:hypothetical protein
MNQFDAPHVTGLLSERRSRLDVDEPGAWHSAITPGPDLLVQHLRPIVADLLGPGRIGLGTLLAPADSMVIFDASCYRLDAGMSVCRVSPLERPTASHPQPVTPAATGLPTESSPSSTLSERARDRRHTGALLLELDRSPTAHDRASGQQSCSMHTGRLLRRAVRDPRHCDLAERATIRAKPAGISGGRPRGESHCHAHWVVRAADSCQRKVKTCIVPGENGDLNMCRLHGGRRR